MKAFLTRAWGGVVLGAQALASAVLWFLLVALAGSGLLVAGFYVMLGPGPALIAAGVICLLMSMFILRGIARG